MIVKLVCYGTWRDCHDLPIIGSEQYPTHLEFEVTVARNLVKRLDFFETSKQ